MTTLVELPCTAGECTYKTPALPYEYAFQQMATHRSDLHTTATTASVTPNQSSKQKAPELGRPKIARGASEETWNTFVARWTMWKRGTVLDAVGRVQHLFECYDEDLGDSILKGYQNAVHSTENELLDIMKRLAVIPVALCAKRADLLVTKQDHGESMRAYYTNITGKAKTCA